MLIYIKLKKNQDVSYFFVFSLNYIVFIFENIQFWNTELLLESQNELRFNNFVSVSFKNLVGQGVFESEDTSNILGTIHNPLVL